MFFYMVSLYFVVMTSSVFSLWVLMEIMMFIFMGMSFLSMDKEAMGTEGLLGYYLTQSGLSVLLLVILLVGVDSLVYLVLLSKLGVFPLNFWFFPVMMKSNVLVLFLMMTFQKIPMFMFWGMYTFSWDLLIIFLLFNLFVCGSIAYFSLDLKALLISSSLANNSWLLLAYMCSLELFVLFFSLYFFTLYYTLFSNIKALSMFSLLSLSGLPPFPLFWVKLYTVGFYFFGNEVYSSFMGLIFMLVAMILSSSYVRFCLSNYVSQGSTLF